MSQLPPSTRGLVDTAIHTTCNMSKHTIIREEIFNGSRDILQLSKESYFPLEDLATLPTGFLISHSTRWHIPSAAIAKFTMDFIALGMWPNPLSWRTSRT